MGMSNFVVWIQCAQDIVVLSGAWFHSRQYEGYIGPSIPEQEKTISITFLNIARRTYPSTSLLLEAEI